MTMKGARNGGESSRGAAISPPVGAGLVINKTSDHGPDAFAVELDKDSNFERRFRRMRRSIGWAGQAHGVQFSGFRGFRPWLVTLTYRPGVDWSPRHLSASLHLCRQWLKRMTGDKLRYAWVAELQQRGAVHYHVVIWLPARLSMPKWDKQRWWRHGMTNVQRSRKGVGYLMKYISKFSPFHEFPKGARIYGVGGLNEQARNIRSWKNSPRWIKDRFGVGEVTRRACGFVVRATGEILDSPWVLFRDGPRLLLRAVEELPARYADGPYTRLEAVGV